jgi:hypothetical protein
MAEVQIVMPFRHRWLVLVDDVAQWMTEEELLREHRDAVRAYVKAEMVRRAALGQAPFPKGSLEAELVSAAIEGQRGPAMTAAQKIIDEVEGR